MLPKTVLSSRLFSISLFSVFIYGAGTKGNKVALETEETEGDFYVRIAFFAVGEMMQHRKVGRKNVLQNCVNFFKALC